MLGQLRLPVEILLAIIEEAGMQPRPNFDLLWALSSTCHTIRPYAQKHLFHRVRLQFQFQDPQKPRRTLWIHWKRMEFILDGNPHLIGSMKQIRFSAASPDDITPAFQNLLSRLNRVETIYCGYVEQHSGEWWEMEPEQRQFWITVFEMPSIRKLQICGLRSIPVSALFSCKTLESLHLVDFVSFDEPDLEEDEEYSFNLPLTQFRSLRTTGESFDLEALFTVYPSTGHPLIDRSTVTSLHLDTIQDDDCEILSGFSSLRSFNVHLDYLQDVKNLFDNLHPSIPQSLNCLEMSFEWESYFTPRSCIDRLALAMEARRGFPNLCKAVVDIHLCPDDIPSMFDEGLQEDLGRLDALFASSGMFPRLHTFVVKLSVSARRKRKTAKLWNTQKIGICLPLLASKPNLTLTPLVQTFPVPTI